jgi:putative PIN family toxin of toxin-antitoxin system
MYDVVLDTNVIVAALRSNQGASFQLLQELVGRRPGFRPCLSVPLVLEYESALRRRVEGLSEEDVEVVLNYLCKIGNLREIYFLWRPFLRDPTDGMVLEVGVEAGADAIVTHNIRDFRGVEEKFGIRVVTPGTFLLELRESKR